jgi:RNA polymerase sigma factor (sigma-70 family)
VADTQANAVLGYVRRLATAPPVSRLTDPQLLERFRRDNDQEAFAALVQRHGPLVRKVCWRVLRHAEDAEDAFQATFLVLARHVDAIRRQGALGSFLHGAAYRTALRARRDLGRRRRHEREAPRMARSQPNLEVAWREIQAVLDEETAALPEKYRAVFVLCCLEGQSKPEAARHLGLKEGTVSSRLAHARKLLQQRLTRRGLTLTAVLGAVAVSEQSAAALAAPAVRATAAAALAFRAGAAAPGRAASLAEGMGRSMFASRCKLIVSLVVALGVAAGAGAMAQRPPAATAEPPPPAARTETQAAAPALEETADAVTFRGRVVGPDGKPFPGADVGVGWYRGYALEWWPWVVPALRPAKGGTSGPDGRFAFTLTKAEMYATMRTVTAHPWREVQVVATAKGTGPGWAYIGPDNKKDLTLRLVPDDVAVKGRVVDLQGQPVAGARARLAHLTAGGNFLTVNAWPGLPAEVRTDKEGRFVFPGVGRGREVTLDVSGPAIEHKLVSASTAAGKEGRGAGDVGDVVAGPTKPVVGTVRARDTGKPLAGVVVFGERTKYRGAVSAVTDAEGRYRLLGLPKQDHYQLTFQPPDGQPYLSAVRPVAGSEGLKPLTADCELRRGVPVRFRLIDKETRKPVRARVQYTPTQDNPLYPEAEAQRGLVPNRVFDEVQTPDGEQFYHFVAYPGPGVIVAFGWYSGRLYLPARLSEADAAKGAGRKDPHMMFLDLAVGYRLLNPTQEDALTFEIELDPGRTLTGKLLGSDGEPVQGAMSSGLVYTAQHKRVTPHSLGRERKALPTESFTVECVAPDTPRTIAFAHEGRKLIGHRVLRGDEKGPLTVRLQPWGAATGRLVDAGGKPFSDVRILLVCPRLPAPGLQPLAAVARTDAEGRFRVEGLAPGLNYELQLRRGEAKSETLLSAGDAVKGITARAGEVKDLGDIRAAVPADKPKE